MPQSMSWSPSSKKIGSRRLPRAVTWCGQPGTAMRGNRDIRFYRTLLAAVLPAFVAGGVRDCTGDCRRGALRQMQRILLQRFGST
jgi:hypothetical protein